ncbi:MAG: recombinase, partial [Polaromonas sp.]|nr:recombinase [Polaromonas sp.]
MTDAAPTTRPLSTLANADLAELLDTMDAEAPLVQRHIWLIALLQWVRGNGRSAQAAAARVDIFLDVMDVRPALAEQFRRWWQKLMDTVDDATLLSDYGFASRNAFVSELVERLHRKLLPATPETADAGELFTLVLPDKLDAQWIATLSPATLERLAALLTLPAHGQAPHAPRGLTHWQASLIEAITFCTSNIRAVGFAPEIRLRMRTPARADSPFHTLSNDFETLRDAWWDLHCNEPEPDAAQHLADAATQFKAKLEACRQAAASVYTHLDSHGISMDLVFRLRQLRERVLRIRALLDCLMGEDPLANSAKLLSHLASVGQDQRSLGVLLSSNSSLLAAKVAERSSETGEHYITRNAKEYRAMLGQAAGGGALTAGTTALKFAILAVGLSAFWSGFWAGVMYAASFVLIQLLHFTLATKQPAMTAPAMAAKLKDISDPSAVESFVDE